MEQYEHISLTEETTSEGRFLIITIFVPEGKLTEEVARIAKCELLHCIRNISYQKNDHVILDVRTITSIDTNGISLLLIFNRFCRITDHIRSNEIRTASEDENSLNKVLRISLLDKVLTIVRDTVEEKVN